MFFNTERVSIKLSINLRSDKSLIVLYQLKQRIARNKTTFTRIVKIYRRNRS